MHSVNNKNTTDDKMHEECGIFGGYSKCGNISPYIKYALLKLQHRGQESAGLCAGGEKQILYKNPGLVNFALNDNEIENIPGNFGIGHVRYSTSGGCGKENIQPLKVSYLGEDVSLAHNGNVPGAQGIREKFERQGEVFLSSSDSEVILKSLIFSLKKAPSKLHGRRFRSLRNKENGYYFLLRRAAIARAAIPKSRAYVAGSGIAA